jgi:hypothetical protein
MPDAHPWFGLSIFPESNLSGFERFASEKSNDTFRLNQGACATTEQRRTRFAFAAVVVGVVSQAGDGRQLTGDDFNTTNFAVGQKERMATDRNDETRCQPPARNLHNRFFCSYSIAARALGIYTVPVRRAPSGHIRA